MWLTCSSIGRKFVMAITGICLVLFVTFHCVMNAVALIWPAAYNQVCELLGANWYALIASAGLALLFIIHIIYALWLTVKNRKARGNDRYAVTAHAPGVEWSSKNMLVLGIVVLAFLVVHLIQFWAKMQLVELCHGTLSVVPQAAPVNGIPADPAFGTIMLQIAFSQWWTPVVYIIGFVALWFHMNHGFWSMFQTIGWNGRTWLPRLKKIALWWTTIVIALFVAQAVVFTVQANRNYYVTDGDLLHQYAQLNDEYGVTYASNLATAAEPAVQQFMQGYQRAAQISQMTGDDSYLQQFIKTEGNVHLEALRPFAEKTEGVAAAQNVQVLAVIPQIIGIIESTQAEIAAQEAAAPAAEAAPAMTVPVDAAAAAPEAPAAPAAEEAPAQPNINE